MERLSHVWSRLGGPGPGEGLGCESIPDKLGYRGGGVAGMESTRREAVEGLPYV
jgi:hypothetical protein